ncbi:hypothetical protein [Nonomuraea sp. SYSU D8015]|uniref:hypothetical protein n=1 Tax=Nonomuraea sp. SYSU D8015 TaxID=2593644 RepID=UPI0016610C00|nr:hypothetical protein [Nonomuraea sp. SYSU D8015]
MRRRLRAAREQVDFDSSVNMVRALGRFLRGKDHRAMSVGPGSRTLAALATAPPARVRRLTFRAMGYLQGLPLQRARQIRQEDLDHWVVRQYGPGPFPAVVVGAASGAALHLAAALGAPFLPQTTLVAVRDVATHPDDPVGAMHALAPTARLIAENNPDLSVYHMHDPAQDRPMLEAMAYMRLKRLRLGRAYERFLEERLVEGGTVILLDCTRTWRSTATGERSCFQFGCLGGLTEEEYFDGDERVTRYLEDEGSPRRRWEPPEPDDKRAEAEWGLDAAIVPDLEELAERHGHRLRRLSFPEPQDLSPFVADLYRWWHRRRDLPADRLVVESYVQADPHWMLRTGSVPFWMRFNMGSDYEELDSYLRSAQPYRSIHLNVFSQGLWSPAVVPIPQWQELISRYATEQAEIIGVDTRAYPSDTGSSLRYQPAYRALPARHPMPPPLPPAAVDDFLAQAGTDYTLTWR